MIGFAIGTADQRSAVHFRTAHTNKGGATFSVHQHRTAASRTAVRSSDGPCGSRGRGAGAVAPAVMV